MSEPDAAVRLGRAEIADFLEDAFPGSRDTFLVEEVGVHRARVRLRFDEARLRPGGTISGPALMTLADTAMWVALLAMIGPVALSVTVSLGIDFLRKAAPGDVVAEVRLLKVGRRLAVGEVLMYSEGDERPVARANVTYSIPAG